MDSNQLITIVVTAVITAIAKEVVIWLLSIVKTLSIPNTIKAKLKATFTKTNRAIIGELILLIFYVLILIWLVKDPAPASKMDVLLIIGSVCAILFMLVSVLFRIAMLQVKKTKPP